MPLCRIGLAVLTALGLSGCLHRRPPPAPRPVAAPHYHLGSAYRAGAFWYYPAEDLTLDATGIATVEAPSAGLTADGELHDPAALEAAMQTIQLPAIVDVTNLENGRQVTVRVNDRGPAAPGRIIAVSPRAALLLALPQSGAARVRVRLDAAQSRAAADEVGGAPQLQIATAPRAAIEAESLPPPGTSGNAARANVIASSPPPAQAARRAPQRLPERIVATQPQPGTLMITAGRFNRAQYADVVAARLAGLGAGVVRSRVDRQTTYTVQAGPFATIAQADSALDQALRSGVVDARIVVQ